MSLFSRRGKVRISNAGMRGARGSALEALAGAISFGLAFGNSVPIMFLGAAATVFKGWTSAIQLKDERQARVQAQVAALRDYPEGKPPRISTTRKSYDKAIRSGEIGPTDVDYVAFLCGSLLKGPGASTKPSKGTQSVLEPEVNSKVEMLDVGMVGSSIDDMGVRQISVANGFLEGESIHKGGKIRVIVMSFESQNETYNVGAALRPVLGEFVSKNSHKNVVPGGARLVIVAPNTYKNVVPTDGTLITKAQIQKLQDDAAELATELKSTVEGYIRDNPEFEGKITIIECGDKICYSDQNRFYLAPSDLNDLQNRIAEAAVPAFTEKLDKKINVSLSSGLVHIEGTDEIASPTIKVEPLVQPGDHNYDKDVYANAQSHAQDVLEGGIVYHENGDISIEEKFTPYALVTGAPPELRITISASRHSRFTINTHDADIETDGSLEEIRTITEHGETSVKAAGLFVGSSKDGDISVEEAQNVAIKTDSGVVTVGHVHKDCVVSTESSMATIWKVKGNYHARSENGDLYAYGVDGGFDAETKRGKISWKRAGVLVNAKGSEVKVGNVSAKASLRYNEDGNFSGVEGSWNLAEFRPDPNLLLEVYPPEPQPKQDVLVSNPARSLAAAQMLSGLRAKHPAY